MTDSELPQGFASVAAPLGELMIGETPTWTVGVCQLRAEVTCEGPQWTGYRPIKGGMEEPPERLAVYGDYGDELDTFPLHAEMERVEIALVDHRVHQAIKMEHEAL